MELDYRGRIINHRKAPVGWDMENGNVFPCMKGEKEKVRCLRCGKSSYKSEVLLPSGEYYCPCCLPFGRVSSNQNFFHIPPPPLPPIHDALSWGGKLTNAQQHCSQEICSAIQNGKSLLLHAVTGAGKTEMIFNGIAASLSQGKRVGIAIPRVDVCLELYPRLKEAFHEIDICLLYGESTEKFHLTPITLCTTHQLLRFWHLFDVLIIDEGDAFPFVDNEILDNALNHAIKPNGVKIYLTATPKPSLLKEMDKTTCLPARYHGHPLPVPTFISCFHWKQTIEKNKLPQAFKRKLEMLINEGYPLLVFFPIIRLLSVLEKQIHHLYPQLRFSTVSSIDTHREEKILQFRNGNLDMLIATTILERGVTFKNISVLVLGSDHQIFTTSTLVQIAGRCGRSKSRPNGTVLFLHDGKTKAMVTAKKKIIQMNKKAKIGGYLL